MFSLEDKQVYSNWTEVFNLVGERIPTLLPGNKIELGYTRALFHPVLLRVTKPIAANDLGLEIEGGDETPVLILTTKEIRQLYKTIVELLYPLTWFLDNVGYLIDVYSKTELASLIEQKCTNLIHRACEFAVNTKIEVPEMLLEYYELDAKEYELALQGLTKYQRILSSLYTATPDHPECDALETIIKDYPFLVCDAILLSPFCIPNLAKNISLCSILSSHHKIQQLFEQTAYSSEEPKYCFTQVTNKIPGIFQRKEEFVQAVMGHCAGPWIYELDFSQSSICGGAICHALSIILARPLQDTSYIDEQYLPFKLKRTKKQVDDAFVIRIDEWNYKVVPKSDIDIAIHDKENFNEIVAQHFKVIGAYYPKVLLTKSSNKYKIISNNPKDYISGFRDIEFYYEAKYGSIQHHVPMVRAFYDGQLHATLSCLHSHIEGCMNISQYNYHLGRTSAKSILKKYSKRGFRIYGCNMPFIEAKDSITLREFPIKLIALHHCSYDMKYILEENKVVESCPSKEVLEKEKLLSKLDESTFKVEKQRVYSVVDEAPDGLRRECVRQDLTYYWNKCESNEDVVEGW